MSRGALRAWTRSLFFTLFILAPIFDIFRLDLTQGHFIFFGMNWRFGLETLASGDISAARAALNILLLGFIPVALVVGLGIWVSWKYGRLYCGWLCPHFSVVEMINKLMRRASGKLSVWERQTLPEAESTGENYPTDKRYWPIVAMAILGFAFVWAVVLLTYLLPPDEIYGNLFSGELTRNQGLFIGVATLLFSLEFLLARHLFCRFGCAVGLFQSLAWMSNDRALVVSFDKSRGEACKSCSQACDNACPMRLNPRKNKRHMFTCTQCTRCVEACENVQTPGESLMTWQTGGGNNAQSDRQAPTHFSPPQPQQKNKPRSE